MNLPKLAPTAKAKAHLEAIKQPRQLWDGYKWVMPTLRHKETSIKKAPFHHDEDDGTPIFKDQISRVYVYGENSTFTGWRIDKIVDHVKRHLIKHYKAPVSIRPVLFRYGTNTRSRYFEDVKGVKLTRDGVLHLAICWRSDFESETGMIWDDFDHDTFDI